MKDYIRRILRAGTEFEWPAQDSPKAPVPVVWLLGKTGAGKTSLILALTGTGQPGEGFVACTRTARAFDFPADYPLLRFLDTRGLGEAGYDPAEDLAKAEAGSHAVLVLARLDDPVQGAVADVLADLCKRRPKLPVIVVHTGADLIPDTATRGRAYAATQARLETGAGRKLRAVTLALGTHPDDAGRAGLDQLRAELVEMLPDLSLLMMQDATASAEAARFQALRPQVLRFASAAGASDAAPIIGTVSVPALQGAMLHRLAAAYALRWTPARIAAFATALGTGTVLRMAASHGLRQAGKLVPVVGQSLGAAAAAAVSFAATYALGRAAAYWLYRTSRNEPVDAGELRRIYAQALRSARNAPD